MKYINKILLTFFIAFTILLSGKYSVSADVSDSRNFSEYLENTNYNKTQSNSYEVIKLNDYMIPEGEEDEIITINPSSDNSNNINTTNTDSTNENISNDENNKTESSSLETNTPENNISSETSSAEKNLETSTSSALPEIATTTSTSSETSSNDKDETQTATPTVNSSSKNTNNSSSGSSNTSEKSFDRFDLAVSNFMVFLLLVTILLYKFSPKLKVLIKSITSNKDEE
ncbi:MAG: hypothetical protein SOY42_03020 [Clostridium sp.]|nr:hypothetical protein [Clostridium sp.]